MLNRRKWLAVAIAIVGVVITGFVAYFLPNKYESFCLILVEPPEVAEQLLGRDTIGGEDLS